MRRWSCAAALAVLIAAACTPSSSEPPNPTLTPALPTPAESSFERQQRLDFEAAEKSYREFRAEYRRVLAAGGAGSATSVMKKTADGPYLKEFTPVVVGYKKKGWKQRGPEEIVYVRDTAHFEDHVTLDTCEDGRDHATYDRNGKLIGRGELRVAHLIVKHVDDVWKVWSVDGEKVSSCK